MHDAATWYEERRVGLGSELLAEARLAIERTRQKPRLHTRLETIDDGDVYRVLLKRLPYSIVYVTTDVERLVIAFAHTSRRPNYWIRRRRPD